MNRIAVFTIVRNESVFLPLWYRYYFKHFDASEIYILNNQSDDNSIESLRLDFPDIPSNNIVNVPSVKWFNHVFLRDTVIDFQKKLLESVADIVVFAEADEIICVDPEIDDINFRNYLQNLNHNDIVYTNGYDVWHDRGLELAIDLRKPILRQRDFWYKADYVSKPLISKVPLNYEVGFHNANNVSQHASIKDPAIKLIHLHYFDYNTCKQRTEMRASKPWNESDAASGAGHQNRKTGYEFDVMFDSRQFQSGPVELIPERFKGII